MGVRVGGMEEDDLLEWVEGRCGLPVKEGELGSLTYEDVGLTFGMEQSVVEERMYCDGVGVRCERASRCGLDQRA